MASLKDAFAQMADAFHSLNLPEPAIVVQTTMQRDALLRQLEDETGRMVRDAQWPDGDAPSFNGIKILVVFF